MGDYFKKSSHVLNETEPASDLIAWLHSKTIVLALLCKHQIKSNKSPLSVIQAILTQWTSHLRTYKHLLNLRPHLVGIVYEDEACTKQNKLIVTGDAKAKQKSREMCALIKRQSFWDSMVWYVKQSIFILYIFIEWLTHY